MKAANMKVFFLNNSIEKFLKKFGIFIEKLLHEIENYIYRFFYCALVELFGLKELKNKYRILITDAILSHLRFRN